MYAVMAEYRRPLGVDYPRTFEEFEGLVSQRVHAVNILAGSAGRRASNAQIAGDDETVMRKP
jgi:hypothetical protein